MVLVTGYSLVFGRSEIFHLILKALNTDATFIKAIITDDIYQGEVNGVEITL